MVGADKVRQGQAVSAIDALTFFTGRVERVFASDHSQTLIRDLRPNIDRKNKKIRSTTGEVEWDFGNGILKFHSEKAQGACGFLNRMKSVDLPLLSIQSQNEYCAVTMVSLDDRPLRQSRRILLQVATEDKPFGFRTVAAKSRKYGTMKKIVALGGYPLNVRRIQGSVTLKGIKPVRVTALDENGYPVRERVQFQNRGGSTSITLPPNRLYLLIQQ